MSNSELFNNTSEENIVDPAWKPLKSKRQIFEGVEGQYLSPSISNLDSNKSLSNNNKKFEIESGIVEQRKIAVIESKEISNDSIKRTESNIEEICHASSEAKQLRDLLENNSSTSPNTPVVRSSSFRKEPSVSPKKNISPKPLKLIDSNIQISSENVNMLYNNIFQEIENVIESDLDDIPLKPKPVPKIKPAVPSKPNSAAASPVPIKRKLPPPAIPSKPGTPTRPSTPSKTSNLARPSTQKQDSSIDKESISSSLSPVNQQQIDKTTPPSQVPDKPSIKEAIIIHSTSIKKTLPAPPLPAENNESIKESPQVKKASSPSSITIEKEFHNTITNKPNENNNDIPLTTESPSNTSPTSIISLQKKALMLKNTKKMAPPPPSVQNSIENINKDKTQNLTNQLSRSLSLEEKTRNNKTKNQEIQNSSKTVPCTPVVSNNAPPFLQLPTQSSISNIQENSSSIPNLCEVKIHEEKDSLMESCLSNNSLSSMNNCSRRIHPVSMYTPSNKISLPPSIHYRARSSTNSSYGCEFEAEKLPDSLRCLINEQEINENEISFYSRNEQDSKKSAKDNEPVVAEKTNNRSFLFSMNMNQESKNKHHQSKIPEVPDSMRLLFGGFGNIQELDSDSENESEIEEFNNDNTIHKCNPISSTIILENSANVIQKDSNTTPKIYSGSNKDKNCRNSSIINASIVPPNEPPIPSLDKKPYRGNTLRWVINVNC
ncbi:hypothetical protein BCR36DRAFT_335450 [Piromyces finnis]|uniref:Uncharacterized protein n=1 Tax=Piromyces finnis TaxID=1754191 RepID=A0A1Y1UYV9_9FUNG|nr:hypothetical protein BCR36DRAFT_335450 [Piromyces finnis]|eukprot:ORX43753.1 hypothetical protein BCR36DRAFT_335450 [Piromyces finnis]